MTRNDILSIPAGREMDVTVGVHVMKLLAPPEMYPDYSTCMSDSMIIVKHFNNQCMMNNVQGLWECYFPNGEGRANSLPLAICRAALVSVIGEE